MRFKGSKQTVCKPRHSPLDMRRSLYKQELHQIGLHPLLSKSSTNSKPASHKIGLGSLVLATLSLKYRALIQAETNRRWQVFWYALSYITFPHPQYASCSDSPTVKYVRPGERPTHKAPWQPQGGYQPHQTDLKPDQNAFQPGQGRTQADRRI